MRLLNREEADKMMVRRAFGGEVIETDQESTGSSSEEMDSPRSVAKVVRRWSSKEKKNRGLGICSLHSQILRIRDEDSLIGEDVCEILNLFGKDDNQQISSVVLISKQILPSSPLSGKTGFKTGD